MPRRRNGPLPPYCLHKQSGQGYVRLNGRQILLGKHGCAEGHREYRRVLAEWQAHGNRLPEELQADVLESTKPKVLEQVKKLKAMAKLEEHAREKFLIKAAGE